MKYLAIAIFASMLFCSCSKDDENQNNSQTPPTPDATFQGSWEVDEVQILNSPSNSSGVWKSILVGWGSVSASSIGSMTISFNDSSWLASGFVTNNAVKSMIHDNNSGGASANGTYTRTANSFTLSVDNYTGRGPNTGYTSGSYSISGNKMTMTFDLADGEKWKVILKKD